MKARWIILTLLIAAAAGFIGWTLAKRGATSQGGDAASGRQVSFYQSPMHPWIKSDQPGNCTICGMKLTPVYEGEKGFDVEGDMVALSTNTINVIHVRTTIAERGPIKRTVKAAGIVDDDDTRRRMLSAYVGGRIEELSVNYPGAIVKKGEMLARIYSPELLTAEREYASLLSEGQNGAGALQGDRQRLREAAEQRLRRLGLSPEQIAGLKDKASTNSVTDILAPFDGTVVQSFVFEGQYVAPGERLFELADFSRMWVEFSIYEQDLQWIKVGTAVEITTPATGGKVYSGRVSFIDPNLSLETRAALARVEIENPLVETPDGRRQYELQHRLYATGHFEVARTNALKVPRSAVISAGNGPVVYVEMGSGSYEQRKVRLGFRGDHVWEILEGVQEGEPVVSNGAMLIDAQAQLNQQASSGVTPHEHAPVQQAGAPSHIHTTAKVSEITPEQEQALRALLQGASDMAAGLAADDVAAFNKAAPQLAEKASHLGHLFSSSHEWSPALGEVARLGAFKVAADLPAARAQFIPFSNALAQLARAGRNVEPFASVKLYQCPMADRAVAGVPKRSLWVQMDGPLRNPFFGSEMLTCGTEAKP